MGEGEVCAPRKGLMVSDIETPRKSFKEKTDTQEEIG